MPSVRVKIHNPKTMTEPTGYSHVAEVRGGKLEFIAGQVALSATVRPSAKMTIDSKPGKSSRTLGRLSSQPEPGLTT